MKTIPTLFLAGALATLSALSMPAFADGTMDHSKMGEMKMAQAGVADMTDGEVRKVDMDQGKVTLKHGEIKNLDMPPMTMVFTVKDKAMLQGVKPGDKVKFKAANADGKLTVTDMAPAK
ncbi:MAG: copper-binding protein [Comamonadaceae bacterium SCN 68-20]|nr:MAG: copper-binding protein [Comamonadaceae bacterium SCN 68-20]